MLLSALRRSSLSEEVDKWGEAHGPEPLAANARWGSRRMGAGLNGRKAGSLVSGRFHGHRGSRFSALLEMRCWAHSTNMLDGRTQSGASFPTASVNDGLGHQLLPPFEALPHLAGRRNPTGVPLQSSQREIEVVLVNCGMEQSTSKLMWQRSGNVWTACRWTRKCLSECYCRLMTYWRTS